MSEHNQERDLPEADTREEEESENHDIDLAEDTVHPPNLGDVCEVLHCHAQILTGHKTCYLHSLCLKEQGYVITDCLMCSAALNAIKNTTYEQASTTDHWRFILHNFWILQANRESDRIQSPLTWVRDDYPHLFPDNVLVGSARTEFRHQFFPDLDGHQTQDFDFAAINASVADQLLRRRISIAQDPLNLVPFRPLAAAGSQFMDVPFSWKVTVEDGELIANQSSISPSGVFVDKRVPDVLIQKFLDNNNKYVLKFCTKYNSPSPTTIPINASELNVKMSGISTFISAIVDVDTYMQKSRETNCPCF